MSSKTSTKEGRRKFRRLQFYLASHKSEILKLISGIKEFQLEEDDNNKETPLTEEEERNNNALEFDLSDDDEPSQSTPSSMSTTTAIKHGDVDEDSGIMGGKLTCGSCGGITVENIGELRQHYKHDWHRYNVKRKLHGQAPVTDTQFYDLMDDLSSIEGSDSEDDSSPENETSAAVSKLMERISRIPSENTKENSSAEDNNKSSGNKKLITSPKEYYENENGRIFGIYKSFAEVIFKNNRNRTLMELTRHFENPLNLTIIMVSGGHFAAAVFQGSQTILHKTFHSYTVRAKQGGSQGSQDSKSGTSHPKSAGASLRRYNEQSFAQHVQELMEAWKERIKACPIIFYRAVGASSNTIFGGKSPIFQRNDPKLRIIPFQTMRPTLTEVKRVHSYLTTLNVYDDREQFLSEHLVNNKSKSKSPKKKQIDRAKSKSPKRRDENPCPIAAISESSDNNDAEELQEYMEEIDFSELKEFDDSLTPEERQAGAARKRSKPKKPKSKLLPFPTPDGILGCILDSLTNTTNSAELLGTHIASLKLKAAESPTNEEFLIYVNQHVDYDGSNLLHVAAQKNSIDLIWPLLEVGCDPAAKNKSGKAPYSFANTKECRVEFRRFMGQFPDKYDYKKAQVPAPLTEELETEKAEKKKLLNKLKREKEKLKKMERQEKEKEQSEQDRFLKLSDREKRALAAEQRILAQCKRNKEQIPILVRCFDCACDMTGQVPFEYNQNVFCTTKCLTAHRKKFPTPLSV